jgi:vacuolar-type H+-ATPase subunit C/Vma6
MLRMPVGLDFLAARLHARRSRLAEAERLDALARLRTIPELVRAITGETAIQSAVELQRRMVLEHIRELEGIARMLDGPAGHFVDWLCSRFQMENLKVLARAFVSGAALDDIRDYFIPLEGDLAVDERAFAAADSIEAFVRLIRSKPLRDSVIAILEIYRSQPKPFFIEAALDHGYFTELLARAAALPEEEAEMLRPMLSQDVDIFHMMLATRGRFGYGLRAELLLPFHVKGAGIRRDRLSQMLTAGSLADVTGRLAGVVIDMPREAAGQGGPGIADAAVLEGMAWNRYLRIAGATFRRSHMGLAAVVAYAAIRRVELGNLITLSEGIRANIAPEAIRRRLIPRADLEATRA